MQKLLGECEASLDNLERVVRLLEELVPSNAIIALNGTLASGKTTLVQAIAKAKGSKSVVSSPTFSLQHSYSNKLYHYDLYRSSFDEIARLGLLEEFDKSGWHLVEWIDEELKKFLIMAGYSLYSVNISIEPKSRKYQIELINA